MKKAIVLLCLVGCSVSKQPSLKISPLSEEEKRTAYHGIYDYDGLRTTNLWRDSLLVDEKIVLLNYSPLLDFEGITRAILLYDETWAAPLKDPANSGYTLRGVTNTCNCDREYTASWYIKGNKLYLGKVTPREIYTTDSDFYRFNGPQKTDQKLIDKRIEQATGRKYKNGLLFADWINGTIEGNIGGVQDSTQSNLVIINSPEKVKLLFKQGVLKKIDVTKTNQ